MQRLVDTHCHIHAIEGDPSDYVVKKWHDGGVTQARDVIDASIRADVDRMICVGTNLEDSRLAVAFAARHAECWATVGVHPHDGADFLHTDGAKQQLETLVTQNRSDIVAIGECGLDYYYEHSPKEDQIELLKFQLELARSHDLPVIFHIREAFDDFWPIFDRYEGLRGVVHSFTGSSDDVAHIVERGLYVGLNGIMTFTKHQQQLDAAQTIPLERLLLETDAPFLTPKPFRGKICKPEHVKVTVEFLAELRGETLEDIARETTKNACSLFGLKS